MNVGGNKMLNGKLTKITCEIPIPEGYEFVRIDNVYEQGEWFIGEGNIPEFVYCKRFESAYLWVIIKKIEN